MMHVLLVVLQAHTNSRGLVLANEETLLRELGWAGALLHARLGELETAGAIEMLTPPPFIVLKLRKWSGKKPTTAKTVVMSGASEDRAYSFQSSLSQSKPLNESYRQPIDDEDALLREILETLGESDPTTFRGAIRSYPPGVIRMALARVRRMKSVRKNRTAVFRFLLPRIAKELPSKN